MNRRDGVVEAAATPISVVAAAAVAAALVALAAAAMVVADSLAAAVASVVVSEAGAMVEAVSHRSRDLIIRAHCLRPDGYGAPAAPQQSNWW